MYLKKWLLSTLLFTGIIQASGSVALNINSDDVELNAQYSLNSSLGYSDGVNLSLDTSYLYNKNNSDLFNIGVNGENSLEAAQGLIFGFGFEVAYTTDFMAIPLLGKIRYILPLDSDIPTTSLFAYYAYAPAALTFLDAETYSEVRLEADMEIISSIHIFTGYRNIDTNYIDHDHTLNDSFYGGLKVSF